ncbi:MAG: hypothetical protein M1814_000577 [Vezdaea aestivalis]|nr:MAG: hypothetical protein M1814_000577 [Vezdaea aestivalis]
MLPLPLIIHHSGAMYHRLVAPRRIKALSFVCHRCRTQRRPASTESLNPRREQSTDKPRISPEAIDKYGLSREESRTLEDEEDFELDFSPFDLPPESPQSIPIPELVQPDAVKRRPLRGTLPVPRKIFPRRGRVKTNDAYILHVAPIAKNVTNSPEAEKRQKIAEARRQNLRLGLSELHGRMRDASDARSLRIKKTKDDRRNALLAPEPDYEKYTKSSVHSALTLKLRGPLPDPGRRERIVTSVERTRQFEEQKIEQKRDALHSLYISARQFITTETELVEEIDRAFVPRPYRKFAQSIGGLYDGSNVWASGPPSSILSRFKKYQTIHERLQNLGMLNQVIDMHNERLRQIAEILTGGKREKQPEKKDTGSFF